MIRMDIHGISAAAARLEAMQPAAGKRASSAGGFADIFRTYGTGTQAAQSLDSFFAQAAETYQVPELLLKAIGYHESGYQADAVSRCGAMGIMQLMPATAQAMGVANPYQPQENIMGGAKLLGQLLQKYNGDLTLTLAAYGAGSGSVAKYGGVPPFEETRKFVEDIMGVMGSGSVPVSGAQEAVSPLCPDFTSQVSGFSGFTPKEYTLFIEMLLEGMRGKGIYGEDEADASPMFFLGRV